MILAAGGLIIWASTRFVVLPVKVEQSNPGTSQEINQLLAKPTKLYIPKMAKVLYVSDGYVSDNHWTTSPNGASYYTGSALPGSGNTVIYGHNTVDTLGGLWRVQNDDYLYVVLQNGEFIKYQVYERKEISPNQVEILRNTDEVRLTLYTCSGFLDQARFVVVAQKVDSPS